ncbi:MAG: cytochrome c [Woeseiaceae bacterium]|nr:cytochrome c [Woeseiaceae bacterium]
MHRNATLSIATLVLAGGGFAFAADAGTEDAATDRRQLVDMPAETQAMMRKEMRDHLLALSEIMAYLAANDVSTAAEVAEARLGRSSMGKHRGTRKGKGPGKFMPKEMKKIGHGMHDAASRFATVAESGDLQKSYTALNDVVAACAACHTSFRIR